MNINNIPLGAANFGFHQFALTKEKALVACGKKILSGKRLKRSQIVKQESIMTTDTIERSKQKEIPARSFTRIMSLVIALEKIERPDLKKLMDDTGIPERSIHSMFGRLNREYFMVIERVDGRRHGFYKVANWGMLNRERILDLAQTETAKEPLEDEPELDFQPI